jgi:hypothetical protein
MQIDKFWAAKNVYKILERKAKCCFCRKKKYIPGEVLVTGCLDETFTLGTS